MCRRQILERTTYAKVRKRSVRLDNYFTFFLIEGYHSRMNSRLLQNHPNIWQFNNFLQLEEERVTVIMAQWSSGASKKKNYRTSVIQSRINTLYKRYGDNLIDASGLLTGLSFVVAKNAKWFCSDYIEVNQANHPCVDFVYWF